jgi:predicted nucleic acid-binding protein
MTSNRYLGAARLDEREYSFVDATSFVLMRRKNVHNAYDLAGDFSAAGFCRTAAMNGRLLRARDWQH